MYCHVCFHGNIITRIFYVSICCLFCIEQVSNLMQQTCVLLEQRQIAFAYYFCVISNYLNSIY